MHPFFPLSSFARLYRKLRIFCKEKGGRQTCLPLIWYIGPFNVRLFYALKAVFTAVRFVYFSTYIMKYKFAQTIYAPLFFSELLLNFL